MSLNLLKDDLTSDPPSVSKVSEKTSVLTSSFSRFAVAGAPSGTAAGLLVGDGTPGVLVAGTAAELLPGAADVATTVLAGTGFGKKVAFLPLNTCHWSHKRTMEKPKITHKMVRRMSFMTFSFLRKGVMSLMSPEAQPDGKKDH